MAVNLDRLAYPRHVHMGGGVSRIVTSAADCQSALDGGGTLLPAGAEYAVVLVPDPHVEPIIVPPNPEPPPEVKPEIIEPVPDEPPNPKDEPPRRGPGRPRRG